MDQKYKICDDSISPKKLHIPLEKLYKYLQCWLYQKQSLFLLVLVLNSPWSLLYFLSFILILIVIAVTLPNSQKPHCNQSFLYESFLSLVLYLISPFSNQSLLQSYQSFLSLVLPVIRASCLQPFLSLVLPFMFLFLQVISQGSDIKYIEYCSDIKFKVQGSNIMIKEQGSNTKSRSKVQISSTKSMVQISSSRSRVQI